MIDWLAAFPALPMFAAAAALPFVDEKTRRALVLLAPAATLWLLWHTPDGAALTLDFLGYRMKPSRGDAVARLFGTVFALMAFAGSLYAWPQGRTTELVAAQAYAASAISACFAGDLVTLFVFWEVMAIGSTVIVLCGGRRASGAGLRYLAIHLFGGTLLMAGIAGEVAATGSVSFQAMQLDSPARWLILAGFILSAGAPPFSAWIPDAYPEASWSGMVFLSAFTTKTAVMVLLRGFPGSELLIWIGLFMVFYGIIYAILENDMRRILAYSIVNQVGFMVAGIGIGTEMALNGAAAHAFAHIIYKALLLMSAGSVLYMTGKRKCTELGGLFRTMPFTTVCGIVGALSISAFPLTSGFVSKSMISDAAAGQHLALVWFLLTAATAGVFLHAGIKFPWFVFFHKDSGLRPPEAPLSMRLAMLLFAALCILIGIFPSWLYALLPFPVEFAPYTAQHFTSQLQLLLFSGLAFFLLLKQLARTETITLDLDWFYRRLGRRIALAGVALVERLGGHGERVVRRTLSWMLAWVYRHHGPHGILGRTWPTGTMALWATLMLGAYLLLYYW